MKRAALIAGVSIATLVCAGPTKVAAAWSAESWWNRSPAVSAPDPAPRKSIKPQRSGRTTEGRADRRQKRQDAADPVGTAARHRLDRQAARDAVRRRHAGRKHRDFLRHRQPSDADGRVHGHPEEPAPRLQSLQRLDALHAAHHLVGLRAPRRTPARLSGVPWLRPPDQQLRATALEGDQDGRARHRHPPRRRADGVRARPPVRAEAEDGGGTAEARRAARESRRDAARFRHPPAQTRGRRRPWSTSRLRMPRTRQPWRSCRSWATPPSLSPPRSRPCRRPMRPPPNSRPRSRSPPTSRRRRPTGPAKSSREPQPPRKPAEDPVEAK